MSWVVDGNPVNINVNVLNFSRGWCPHDGHGALLQEDMPLAAVTEDTTRLLLWTCDPVNSCAHLKNGRLIASHPQAQVASLKQCTEALCSLVGRRPACFSCHVQHGGWR